MTLLTLTADQAGERADQFLARSVEGLTRSAAQKLLEQGAVTAGGRALKKNAKLELGAELSLSLPDPEPIDVVPQDIPLDVVYEDEDVIVINKPVGLVVHPAPGHPDGTLVNAERRSQGKGEGEAASGQAPEIRRPHPAQGRPQAGAQVRPPARPASAQAGALRQPGRQSQPGAPLLPQR